MKMPFELHIIRFDGGLGNQMFEYAFYLSLKQRHPLAFYAFDTYASDTSHNGYELSRIFPIDSRKERNRLAFFRKLERHQYVQFREVKEDNYMTYCPRVYQEHNGAHEYVGFWQTEKYLLPIADKLRKVFRFREELLSDKTREMASTLRASKNAISLHVRRGDYTEIGNTKTFGKEYYDVAVNHLRMACGGGGLIVFSDDMTWVRENLKYEDMIFVDWNTGNDSWQDMYLMSQCTHNIIANSSFSWWGAWLNEHPDKKVIAPKKWMNDEPVGSDIIPKSWIRL